MPGIADLVAGIFKPISDVIDHVLPSGDAKIALQQAALQGQIQAAAQIMDYQTQLLDSQSKIILAEAQGGSWLQRNWRPMLMVFFAALIGARWFGYSAPSMSEAEALELWSIIKIGLGGYVVGRSAEKIAPSVVNAIKATK